MFQQKTRVEHSSPYLLRLFYSATLLTALDIILLIANPGLSWVLVFNALAALTIMLFSIAMGSRLDRVLSNITFIWFARMLGKGLVSVDVEWDDTRAN